MPLFFTSINTVTVPNLFLLLYHSVNIKYVCSNNIFGNCDSEWADMLRVEWMIDLFID